MTSFELFVAADLYGNKVNLELHFPTVPSIAEVTRVTESTFAVEATSLRPEGYPLQAFRLARMLIYDDSHERWVELSHTHQLVDGAQLYAFQRESFHHTETQKPIPPARPPTSRAGGGRVPSIVADNFPSRLPSSSTVGGPAGGPVRQSIHVSPTRVQRGGATNLSSIHEATAATTPPRIVPSSGFISHEEKLRVIFDEMDLNQNRVVETDEWKRTLRVLGIDFTPATTMDLFHKADANGDGVLSVQEFLNFGAMYPTLMDCMFFRAKDYWDTYAKKQSIQALNELLGELREKERAIRADALEVQKDVETQENRLEQAERAVQESIAREKDTRTRIFEVQRETERVQKERLDREHEVEACREKEHQRHTALAEAQQDVHRIEQRVLHQEDELGKAQERERQLQILLVEAQREIERQAKLVQNAQSDLSQAREREQHANGFFLEVQRELQRFMERLAQAEHDVAAKFEQERELEALQLEMQRGTARACHQRDEEERVLAAQREREQQRVRAQNEAMAAVEEHERRLKLLEQELYEVLERKAQTEQQEKPLLEQEVRLREQRDSLEEKENRLKSEVAQFFDVNQRMRASSAASRHPPSMASGIDTTPVCTSSSLYPRAQNTSYVATTSVSSHHHSNSTGAALGNTHQNHYHRTLHTSA